MPGFPLPQPAGAPQLYWPEGSAARLKHQGKGLTLWKRHYVHPPSERPKGNREFGTGTSQRVLGEGTWRHGHLSPFWASWAFAFLFTASMNLCTSWADFRMAAMASRSLGGARAGEREEREKVGRGPAKPRASSAHRRAPPDSPASGSLRSRDYHRLRSKSKNTGLKYLGEEKLDPG